MSRNAALLPHVVNYGALLASLDSLSDSEERVWIVDNRHTS